MKHIPHLYVPGPWSADNLSLTREQQRHLGTVLRLAPGAAVSYTDGEGTVGTGTWSGDVIRGAEEGVERPTRLVLAVAPPANKDRVRFLVEKLAEMGIERLNWLSSKFGTGRIPPPEKLRAWAAGALEQSRGAWLMDIGSSLVGWEDLEQPVVVCQSGGSANPNVVPRTIVVGPEGGFEENEVPNTAILVTLGNTILRVETAAVVAAAKFHSGASDKS